MKINAAFQLNAVVGGWWDTSEIPERQL